jgi:chromosome segregation ATPase
MKRRNRDATLPALLERLKSTESALRASQAENERLMLEKDRSLKENKMRIDIGALDSLENESVGGISTVQDAKIRALKDLHSQKIRSLMKSVEGYKKEIDMLKAENKEHRRTQQIKQLKNDVKDLEITIDVLKHQLVSSEKKFEKEELNDFIIKKTLGGPKRFRPATREELQNQILALEKKMKEKKPSTSKDDGASVSGSVRDRERERSISSSGRDSSTRREEGKYDNMGPAITSSADSKRITELMDEVDRLSVELKARERSMRGYMDQVEELQEQNHQLSSFEEKFKRTASKHKTVVEQLDGYQRKSVEFAQEKQRLEEEIVKLHAEKQWAEDEGRRALEDAVQKQLKIVEELSAAQAKQIEAEEALDKYQRDRAVEKQAKASSSKDSLQSTTFLNDALKEEKALRGRMETKIQTLNNDIVNMKAKLEVAERNASSLEAVLKTKGNVELQAAEARNKLKDVEGKAKTFDDLVLKNKALEKEKYDLLSKISLLEKDKGSFSAAAEGKVAAINDKLATLQAERDTWKDKSNLYENELRVIKSLSGGEGKTTTERDLLDQFSKQMELKTAEFRSEQNILRANLSQTQTDLAQITGKLLTEQQARVQKDHEVTALHAENQSLVNEIKSLQSNVEALKSKSAVSSKSVTEGGGGETAALQKKVSDVELQLEFYKKQVKELEVEKRKGEMDASAIAAADKTIKEQSSYIATLEKSIDSMKHDKVTSPSGSSAPSDDVKKLKDKIKRLDQELDDCIAGETEAINDSRALRRKLREYKAALTSVRQKLKEKEKLLVELQADPKGGKAVEAAYVKEIEKYRATEEDLKRGVAIFQKSVDVLNSHIAVLEKTMAKSNVQIPAKPLLDEVAEGMLRDEASNFEDPYEGEGDGDA